MRMLFGENWYSRLILSDLCVAVIFSKPPLRVRFRRGLRSQRLCPDAGQCTGMGGMMGRRLTRFGVARRVSFAAPDARKH
jgi:hypothetical protein